MNALFEAIEHRVSYTTFDPRSVPHTRSFFSKSGKDDYKLLRSGIKVGWSDTEILLLGI